MYGLPGSGNIAEQLFGVRPERLASEGNGECAAGASEKLHSQRILQRADARADRGLADAQGSGGAVKSAVGAHGQKGFELIDFHRWVPGVLNLWGLLWTKPFGYFIPPATSY